MILVSSWDDGHPLDQRLGEVLDRHGLQGTFFVPIRNREGLPVLSAQSLRVLASRHEIGSHTYDHVYLRDVPREVASSQIRTGKSALEDILGRDVQGFCYPGGRYTAEICDLVRAAGFAYGRTVENLSVSRGQPRYQIATTLQFYPHAPPVLALNLLRYPRRLRKFGLLTRLARAQDFVGRLRAAAEYAHQRDGLLHIWGHSWELERYQLWNIFEEYLRWLRGLGFESRRLCDAVLTSGTNHT